MSKNTKDEIEVLTEHVHDPFQYMEPHTVTRAVLHQSFPLPSGGGVETSLYQHKGVKMEYRSDGLFCEYKGNKFIIPLANVVGVYI